MRKSTLSIIVCLLSALLLLTFAACNDSTEQEALEQEKARAKSPLLGQWVNSTELNGETISVTINFKEDGTVTSTHKDGSNAFAIFESVTWTYDKEKEQLTMTYIDIKGLETSYTFALEIASENYITLIPQVDQTAGQVSKLVLTR